ncbi:hypothetical protein C2G38_2234860 [Gigaspora rosea]|uniref:BTB domain-containing protein n=1 Tax=Gigaspora rosea TaxID=44941 RepID=A0A397TYQ8_9GLOM|nr:hypothetical protein C2G38_2234860 [Gigaspora rosea]
MKLKHLEKLSISLYFHDKLANVIKDNNNIKTINLKNISIEHFEVILKYNYRGVCLLEDFETSFIFELTLVSHEFLLDELVKNIETYLIESQSSWLRLHFFHVYQKSFQNENFMNFKSENALVSIIKRDDLQMKEANIWKHVIE